MCGEQGKGECAVSRGRGSVHGEQGKGECAR